MKNRTISNILHALAMRLPLSLARPVARLAGRFYVRPGGSI